MERTQTPAQLVEDRRARLLFCRFKDGQLDDTDVVHLLGLLGLYDHTPPVEVRREFKKLQDAAAAIKDNEFLSFLSAVKKRFRTYLER